MRTILAIYEIDRQFGGPEEGGWWYDCGTFVRAVGFYRDEQTAYRIAARANALLDRLQRRGPQVDSVIYEGGRHRVIAFTGLPPAYFPAERPRYE